MAPPWGVGWRKCDTRSSVEVPPMFPEGSENRAKKSLIFGCLFGSIWAPFGLHFCSILRWFPASVLGSVFDVIFFDLGAICDHPNLRFWCSRLHAVRISDFSQCHWNSKTTPKYLKKYLPNQPTINQKNIKTTIKIYIRFWTCFCLQNGTKKGPKTIPETLPKKGRKRYPKVLQRAPQNDPKKEPKITKNGLGGLFFTSEKLWFFGSCFFLFFEPPRRS